MRDAPGSKLFSFCTLLVLLANVYALGQATNTKLKPGKADALAIAPPSTQEIEDLEWMRAHTKVGVPYDLDLSQPNQYRFVMAMLKRAGDSRERSPHMFSLLEESRKRGASAEPKVAVKLGPDGLADGTPQPLAYIGRLDATAARSFAATGLLSVAGGTQASQIIISLLAGNQTYAANSDTVYNQGQYFQVPVNGTVPTSVASPTTEANAVFMYVPAGGGNQVTKYYRGQDTINPTSACMALPNYCVRDNNGNCIPNQYQTACTNIANNTTPIKVCYYRGSQQECDYYNQAPGHPTNFVFPLQGNAQFSQNIFATGTTPTGSVTISLENPIKGGGCYMFFQQLAPMTAANWSVPTATPNTINWNFTGASFPDPNSCLEYYGGTNTYMHVQVNSLVMTNEQYGQFEFTSDRSQIGSGVYIVPQIQIQQGCMAAGTRIRMADGSDRAVESFAVGGQDEVKSGAGQATVLDVTHGIEPHPMVRLRTDKGQEILLTSTHPVITPSGPVVASSLKPGGKVITVDGPATLTAVTREGYSGKVFNLRVGSMDDADTTHMTLQANGFIVGDARMQTVIEEQAQNRLNTSASMNADKIPPEWREDYLHHQSAKQ